MKLSDLKRSRPAIAIKDPIDVIGPISQEEQSLRLTMLQPIAKAVRFQDTNMVIELVHGGELVVPLAWFPLLAELPRETLEQYEVCAGGTALHWGVVDEWISVPALIGQPC